MNKKWKFLIVTLCLTLLLSVAVIAHAEPVEHTSEHVLGPWVWSESAARCPLELKPATQKCTFPGCTYEDTQMRPGAGEHHFSTYTPTSPANCVEPGYEEAFCDYCGKYPHTRPQADSQPLGHEFDETNGWKQVSAPTCVTAGKEENTCTVCGGKLANGKKERDIKALGHTYEKEGDPSAKGVTTPATCTEAGKTVYTCMRCEAGTDGHTKEVKIDPLGHTYEDPKDTSTKSEVTKEPTCTEKGTKELTCGRCPEGTEGHTKTVDIDTIDHNTDKAVEEIPATCTQPGKTAGKACSMCQQVQEGCEEIKPLGHEWGEWKVIEKATTKKEGLERRYCTHGELCDGAGEDDETEYDEELGIAYQERTIAKKTVSKPSTGSSSSSSAAPAATAEPAPEYGSIVTDVARADELYEAEIVEEPIEETEDPEDINHVLIITAKPDEDGKYVLRNLHITDELLAKLAEKHIEIVRFVVGDATVEFPVTSFTGEAMEAVKADLESPATAFIVTVDPTATTEEGDPGVSVTAVVACEDGSEYDVTSLVASLTLTYNSTTQPIPDSGIYTA